MPPISAWSKEMFSQATMRWREDGVAVAQRLVAGALAVHAHDGVGQVRVLADVLEEIEPAVPVRSPCVDLLQRDDIRLQALEQAGDLEGVAPDGGVRVEPLVRREHATPVGDVEGDDPERMHRWREVCRARPGLQYA